MLEVTVGGYTRAELPTLHMDALQSKTIVSPNSAINNILGLGCIPQIFPSVIQPVPIAVIDNQTRLVACHPFDDDSMSLKGYTVNLADAISASRSGAAKFPPSMACIPAQIFPTRLEMLDGSRQPSKNAGLRVIVEALSQILMGWQRTWTHRTLQSGSM
jgi:hypothetical protein